MKLGDCGNLQLFNETGAVLHNAVSAAGITAYGEQRHPESLSDAMACDNVDELNDLYIIYII